MKPSARRSAQIKRHWRLVAVLRSWGFVSLERLAIETGVTERTVRRDIEALEDVGVPIEKSDDYEPHWRIMRGAPCPCCGREPKHKHADAAAVRTLQ